jgi:hypothetical protein
VSLGQTGKQLVLGIMLLIIIPLYVNLMGIGTAQVTNDVAVVQVAPDPTKAG